VYLPVQTGCFVEIPFLKKLKNTRDHRTEIFGVAGSAELNGRKLRQFSAADLAIGRVVQASPLLGRLVRDRAVGGGERGSRAGEVEEVG
jgi:hypothetical protein